MSNQLCAGMLIGLCSAAAWRWVFRHARKIEEDESMQKHLQELEADIERGKTP